MIYDKKGNLQGKYTPFYENSSEIQPQTDFKQIINPNLKAQNPDFFYKPNLNRYFNKRNQEYRGLILTSGLLNPLFQPNIHGYRIVFSRTIGL